VSDLDVLQARLGFAFENVELLRTALTHPSVVHEQGTATQHNQRLEFLGDAVLQLVLTRALYEKFPDYGEGPLTKARAHLVNRRTLAEHAIRLGLGEHLILSRGEEMNRGRERPSTLADAFEALLGAMFLDRGFEAVRDFILGRLHEGFADLAVIPNVENPKGELQEVLQARSPESPQYQILSMAGPDHERVFECAVYYRGEELGRGAGRSKKEAESQAASNALTRMRDSPEKAPELTHGRESDALPPSLNAPRDAP
jgi:ribonuclease-3